MTTRANVTFEEARRKARYGHRDWIAYEVDGETVCERISRQAIKQAMLAGGSTKHRFTLIGSDGNLYLHSWRVGVNMLLNFQYIYGAL